MFDLLEQEIVAFYNSIPTVGTSRTEYITLYNYFIKYLKRKYTNDKFPSVKSFLSERLSRFDIINSCVYYLEESNARSLTAIEKYLNAMTFLYNNFFVAKDYVNNNLAPLVPFSTLKNQVKENVDKKNLLEKAEIPVLSESEFHSVCNHMKNDKRLSLVKRETYLIWKLLLLYGFKFERIKFLEIKDYDGVQRTLTIHPDENESIVLELPANLAIELDKYISSHEHLNGGYMFLNTKGKVITSAFIDYPFKQLRKKHDVQGKVNAFNATGLAKYAISRMLETGLDVYNIRKITGMEDIVIDYCQRDFLKKKGPNLSNSNKLNDFINSKLTVIPTKNYLY